MVSGVKLDLGILRDCHDFDGRSDRWVSFRTELLRNCIPGLPVRFDPLILQGSLCLSDQVRPSTPIQEAGSGSLWGAAVCWSAKAQCAQSTNKAPQNLRPFASGDPLPRGQTRSFLALSPASSFLQRPHSSKSKTASAKSPDCQGSESKFGLSGKCALARCLILYLQSTTP